LPFPEQTPQWIEVLIAVPPERAEVAADFLFTLTGHGVQMEEESDWLGLAQVRGFLAAGADTRRPSAWPWSASWTACARWAVKSAWTTATWSTRTGARTGRSTSSPGR